MNDFAQARKNMVDCQLGPLGVRDRRILDLFESVPRERFVPERLRGVAYMDEDLDLGGGRFLMDPAVFGRMLQAAQPGPDDAVLNIGEYSGYSSVILAGMVMTVVALESEVGQLDEARRIWTDLDICNIAIVKGQEQDGNEAHAPYDFIFLNGAVPEVPEKLVKQLATGGRMVGVLRKPGKGMGTAFMIKHLGEGQISHTALFDAGTPYLTGFVPQPAFVF